MRYLLLHITFFVLACTIDTYGQQSNVVSIDTLGITNDRSLDQFLTDLQTQSFQAYYDQKQIPKAVRRQLNFLTSDSFSIANPGQSYRCCCTSPETLPKRQLLFFSQNKDILLMTYLTGGVGVSTTILLLRLQGDRIVDLWTGQALPVLQSRGDVIKYLRENRNNSFLLHRVLTI